MRFPIAGVVGVVMLGAVAGCGAMSKLGSAIVTQQQNRIRTDMKDHPFMARAFVADKAALQKAIEDAFNATGYPVATTSEAEVRAKPSVSSVANKAEYNVSGPNVRVFWLEMMSGGVVALDGQQVVYITYRKGSSTLNDNFAGDVGGPINDSRKSVGSDVAVTYETKYYKDIMDRIAKAVAK